MVPTDPMNTIPENKKVVPLVQTGRFYYQLVELKDKQLSVLISWKSD